MKYRRLGRNGPQVSAISMGRGAAGVKFDTPLVDDPLLGLALGLVLLVFFQGI